MARMIQEAMRNVIFAAPFPLQTTLRFVRAAAGLADVRLLGIVQEAPRGSDAAPFADVVDVADGLDTRQVLEAARLLEKRHGKIHRLLGILEPLQTQLALVRREMGIAGTDPETAELFRNKARMKDELRRRGFPCARHALIHSWEEAEAFVARVGLPIVLKPPAGMGATGTSRIDSVEALRNALRSLHAGPTHPALAEEFLLGQEYSFETIVVGDEVRFLSISRYYPTPLEVVETPWIQWVIVLPRVIDGPEFDDVRDIGVRAVKALGLETGFTHMEWFRREDGTLAIGEIAARPPGAHIVLANSYAHDADFYRAWARAVVDDAFDGPYQRKYSVGVAYLRGAGAGRVSRVSGVEQVQARIGRHVVDVQLPTIGAPRSDSYEGDGHVICRDPDVEVVKAAMQVIIETIRVEYA